MSDNGRELQKRGTKRSPHEIGNDRALIAQMYFKAGLTHSQIAEELNGRVDTEYTLTRRMIGYEIKSILKLWKEHQDDSDFWVTEAIQRTYWVEQAAWDGWERSLLPKERKITKTGFHGQSDFEEISELYENGPGDKGYLKIVLDAISERNRLRGIGAARLHIEQRTEHIIKTYAVVSPEDWDTVDGEVVEPKKIESG